MFAIARTVQTSDGTEVKLNVVYLKADGVIISKEDPETGNVLEQMNFTPAEADALYHLLQMSYTAVTQAGQTL